MFKWIKKHQKNRKKTKPDIDITEPLLREISKFKYPIVIFQILIITGTLVYALLEDYPLMTAFFQAAYTFTTTGFGSLKEGEFGVLTIIFTAIFTTIGSVFIAFCVGFVVNIIVRGKLVATIKEIKMVNKIARLKNHYVLCYHNDYTIALAMQFKDAQIPFVLIDNHPSLEEEAFKYKIPYFILGDPQAKDVILKSHLSSAKGIVIFSTNHVENIALISTIKIYQATLKRPEYNIISIARNKDEEERLKQGGCNYCILATDLVAQRVRNIIVKPGTENIIEHFIGEKESALVLEEIIVPKYSWLVLKKLKESHLRENTKASIVGIEQKDGKYIAMPSGNVLITSESKLLIIGTANYIKQAKRLIMRKSKPDELKYI